MVQYSNIIGQIVGRNTDSDWSQHSQGPGGTKGTGCIWSIRDSGGSGYWDGVPLLYHAFYMKQKAFSSVLYVFH